MSVQSDGFGFMKPAKKLEHFLPIRYSDLVEFLSTGKGLKTNRDPLDKNSEITFRAFAESIRDYYECRLIRQFDSFRGIYSNFDPDRDTLSLRQIDEGTFNSEVNQFYRIVHRILEKANYCRLPKDEAKRLMEAKSFWGIELVVDWNRFDFAELYYRGDTISSRTVRKWWKLWIPEVLEVPEYDRVVVVFKEKVKPGSTDKSTGKSVYLKMFKDIPKSDLDMILPETKLKLTKLDRGLIMYPILSGIALVLYKVLADFFKFRDIFAIGASVSLSWSLAIAFAGYGYKTYSSYFNKKTVYSLRLTRNLYYQSIDNNAGVFHRLLDEAKEQEAREALLAFFYLWKNRHRESINSKVLDDEVQHDLKECFGLECDFEVSDALHKLTELEIVKKIGDEYSAIGIETATAELKKRSLNQIELMTND